jgi:hypothetical protein
MLRLIEASVHGEKPKLKNGHANFMRLVKGGWHSFQNLAP